MPELAEAEHFRRRWNPALGSEVIAVEANLRNRVYRGTNGSLINHLVGTRFERSEALGKQILFVFARGIERFWLGVHLGMAGSTRLDPLEAHAQKHDHLRLTTSAGILTFNDQRYFGRVRIENDPEPPLWWRELPPDLLSSHFKSQDVADFLQRKARSPLKAVLLQQERFPGIGNWMADEILWRARLSPQRRAGTLLPEEVQQLYQEIRWVCRGAYRFVAPEFGDPPPSWLFRHRWQDGGDCPRCQSGLVRDTVGGRTTCSCPECQPEQNAPASAQNPRSTLRPRSHRQRS